MQSHCGYFKGVLVTVGDGHAAGYHVGIPDGFHLSMERFWHVVSNQHSCSHQPCPPCTRHTSWWCRQTGCRGRWGRTPPPAQSWRRTWRWSPRCQRRRRWLGCSFAAPPISPPSAGLRCTCAEGSRSQAWPGEPLWWLVATLAHRILW